MVFIIINFLLFLSNSLDFLQLYFEWEFMAHSYKIIIDICMHISQNYTCIFICMKLTEYTVCHLYLHVFNTDHFKLDNLQGLLTMKKLYFLYLSSSTCGSFSRVWALWKPRTKPATNCWCHRADHFSWI